MSSAVNTLVATFNTAARGFQEHDVKDAAKAFAGKRHHDDTNPDNVPDTQDSKKHKLEEDTKHWNDVFNMVYANYEAGVELTPDDLSDAVAHIYHSNDPIDRVLSVLSANAGFGGGPPNSMADEAATLEEVDTEDEVDETVAEFCGAPSNS